MDKKSTKDLMQMLDLNETIDQLAKTNIIRWYGHVLRKDKNNFLRMALDVKIKVTRKGGRLRKTSPKAVIEQSIKVGLNFCDANNRLIIIIIIIMVIFKCYFSGELIALS